jgi:outer membrane usher protein
MWTRLAAVAVTCALLSIRCFALATPADASLEELWLGVELNGQQSDDVALYLRGPAPVVLAPAARVKSWRMRLTPRQRTISYDGELYVALDTLPGLKYEIDEDRQILILHAPPELFEQVTLRAADDSSATAPPPPLGGFLNYDLVAAESDSHSALSGLIEASVFGPAGAGVVRYLARQEIGPAQVVRLDSTWTLDEPASASSFRVGDSITGASAWGGAVRFGGIQWASNYATRPGLITMPLPSVHGEAALPSSLNLYVDDALRLQNSLPGGPYRIEDIPVVTGEGDIRLVVRDLLGREQVITEPYYASPELLRPGLQAYSLEMGFERENFGATSNDYGRPLLVATDKIGLTDRLTGEAHAEVLQEQQTAGLSAALRVTTVGVMDLAGAASHSRQGTGELLSFGFQRAARRLSVGVQVEYANRSFERLGMLPYQPQERLTSQLFGVLGVGHLGSLSASYTRQDYYQARSLGIVSIRDSINVGWLGYLALSVIRTAGNASNTTVALSLTHSINARTSLSATTNTDATGTTTELDMQQSLPAGRGVGYRFVADAGAIRALDGTVDLQGDAGTYELEARKQPGSSLAQVSASGGIALLGSHLFPTRQIDGSFAVVQVGDASNVRVYRENQLVGQTDASGLLLVPGLRAYQDNSLRIEQADLPLDVVIDSFQAQAVPYFRSGVVVNFPVEHPRGALLSVRLENGEPLPTGALVKIESHEEEFPSGTNGDVYVTGLSDQNELRAEWRGKSCRFTVLYTPSPDPLPHLGPYVCRSVAQ